MLLNMADSWVEGIRCHLVDRQTFLFHLAIVGMPNLPRLHDSHGRPSLARA